MEKPVNNQASSRVGVIALLREHGITPTQQRIEIGRMLFEKTQHVSAEQVLAQANQGRESVSKATVYNTLGLFAEKGLIREVIVDRSKLVYDTNVEPHHHIYHADTGVLEDVGADEVSIAQLPDSPAGTKIEGVDVVIRVRRVED